jgi:hypothetical protein
MSGACQVMCGGGAPAAQQTPIQAVLTLAGQLTTVAGAEGTVRKHSCCQRPFTHPLLVCGLIWRTLAAQAAREVFHQAFSKDVASALSIDAGRVIIDSITAGSVVHPASFLPSSPTAPTVRLDIRI